MKTFRQIFANWTIEQVSILHQYNIDVKEGCNSITINEGDVYLKLKPYFKQWQVIDTRAIKYTKKEVLSASFCVLRNWVEGGFPMPDNDNTYIHQTYDLDTYCQNCGIGKVQKDSFKVKSIPKHLFWGLQWIYDEFFVNIEVYNNIFKPLGIDCRTVRLYKDNQIIDSVVQLVIPVTSKKLDMTGYESSVCPVCGSVKYTPVEQVYFPLQKKPECAMYKSMEYFGDGAFAYKKIFISADLKEKLINNKLVKIDGFIPCID